MPIRLAFGGGLDKWKEDFDVSKKHKDLEFILKMSQTIKKIRVEIDRKNSQIRRDLETKDDFKEKSDSEKLNSIMATYTQTWERVLQEECVAHLVRTYPSVRLCDVIPSQDGFMILKSQMVGIDLNDLFTSFGEILKSKFDFFASN